MVVLTPLDDWESSIATLRAASIKNLSAAAHEPLMGKTGHYWRRMFAECSR